MKLLETNLDGVVVLIPARHNDARGYFCETFRSDWFAANVAKVDFVQENQSMTLAAGTIRGLHFQSAPSAQGKLVRCLVGEVFDVAVDIRKGSPTYGKWTACNLSAEQGNQLWIPAGFLHGFCTFVPNCVISYKVTSYYSKDCDRGVLWNDPQIGVTWPDIADASLLSDKDTSQPLLNDLPEYFRYDGRP